MNAALPPPYALGLKMQPPSVSSYFHNSGERLSRLKLCKTKQLNPPDRGAVKHSTNILVALKAHRAIKHRPQNTQKGAPAGSGQRSWGQEVLEERLGNVFNSNWWRWLQIRLVWAILYASVFVFVRCSANGESCQAAQVVKWKSRLSYKRWGEGKEGQQVEGRTSVVFPLDNNFHLKKAGPPCTRELKCS